MKYIDKILKIFDWQEAWKIVSTMDPQIRFEDDSILGALLVTFSFDGDSWVEIILDPKENRRSLRFREPVTGGGQSPRVRQALMILALAINADNEEHKQERHR